MLLVPINLIALPDPNPPFTRQESTEHSFRWGGPRYTFVLPLPSSDGADAGNPLGSRRGPVSGRSPPSKAIKELVGRAPCRKIYASLC